MSKLKSDGKIMENSSFCLNSPKAGHIINVACFFADSNSKPNIFKR